MSEYKQRSKAEYYSYESPKMVKQDLLKTISLDVLNKYRGEKASVGFA